MEYASIGTISHGTLRIEDLLETFAAELTYLAKQQETPDAEHLKLASEAESVDADSEEAAYIVTELEDALNEYAPPYCYFGAHEGDGADFGFWPCMDAIEELPHVDDPVDVEKHRGEACVFVNDHGNVTVYGADGAVIWDCV
jgi:hypothetical protein